MRINQPQFINVSLGEMWGMITFGAVKKPPPISQLVDS